MTTRRVYWPTEAYDVQANTGTPLSDKPPAAQYHSTLTKNAAEQYTYWAADLDIGDIKEIMVANDLRLVLCGNGAPYYLMFEPYKEYET